MELDYSAQIDSVENISQEEFYQKYYLPQKPVKIKGFMKDSPAYTKWTPEYLKQAIGDVEVGVFETGEDVLDRPYNIAPGRMKFSDYVDEIVSGPSNKRLFAFNMFKHNKNLKKDIVTPKWTPMTMGSLGFGFIGGKGSWTRIHRDADNSNLFLTEFYGKKKVVLFPPKYDRLLYKYPWSIHSGVSIDNPDYEKHPGLRYVKGMHTILEAGETLFMPSKYWHYISYLEASIGYNYRTVSNKPRIAIPGIWFVGFTIHADKLLRKMLGDRWFAYKSKKADKRALKEIKRLEHAT